MIRPSRQTARRAHYPAPTGGINTLDGASIMPPTDAPYLYNLLAAEYGLRSRLGWREWCLGLTGTTNNAVPSILPFSGSNPTNNKLFATTSDGIWDVTDSSLSPTQALAFGSSANLAGWGTCHSMSTAAGRFLLYCDEENGYHVYTEAGSWAAAVSGIAQPWEASQTYLVGNQVVSSGNAYECITEGLSSSTSGPSGTSSDITDGTARWKYLYAATANAIGPSLGDQQSGLSIDPADLVFATVFKGRVWLAERNSTRAWYLDTNSIYGVATSFDFGPKMRSGGPLRGLYDWSYDGGDGLDTLLVGISGAGDIVIYQGTDPSSINTFSFKGSWFVGGVPKGRRIATNYGGELLILSLIGVVPLSKLVVGRDPADWKQYETAKIGNLFNQLASERQSLDGWAVTVHPTDNALLILVPTADGAATEQLAMAFGTKGWSRYRDLPILSASIWNGTLYFGTVDGRVCSNTDYVDGVTLGNGVVIQDTGTAPIPASSGTPTISGTIKLKITTSGAPGFSPGGDAAEFKFSTNDGETWSDAAKCFIDGNELADTGVTVAWPTGSYVDDTFHLQVVSGHPCTTANQSTPVDFSGITAFRDETGTEKRAVMVKTRLLSQSSNPLVQCTAKFDFDIEEPSPPTGSTGGGPNSWDSGAWGAAKFGGDFTASQVTQGLTGMGHFVALAFRGSANARTVIVAFDLFCVDGGLLG